MSSKCPFFSNDTASNIAKEKPYNKCNKLLKKVWERKKERKTQPHWKNRVEINKIMTILNHFSSYLEQFLSLWDEGNKKARKEKEKKGKETQNIILKDKMWWKLNFILLDICSVGVWGNVKDSKNKKRRK